MNGDQIRLSYMVNGRFDRSKRLKSWLDAHPDIYPRNQPKYGWIGSMVNEPSQEEIVNCRLYLQPRLKDNDMPSYPIVKKYPAAVVVIQIMRHVMVGEELLVDYGWSHADRESRGYQIYGRKCCSDSFAAWADNGKHTQQKLKINKTKRKDIMATLREKRLEKRLKEIYD